MTKFRIQNLKSPSFSSGMLALSPMMVFLLLYAAIVTLVGYVFMTYDSPELPAPQESSPWLMLPYLVVIATAIVGVNVTLVLTAGIGCAVAVGIIHGVNLLDMAGYMGAGIEGMGGLIIITVGGLSKDISRKYGVDPRKSASILDSASCVVQCLIPYGAQTLLATSLAGISPAAPFPYLYYPWALGITLMLSIVFLFPRRYSRR